MNKTKEHHVNLLAKKIIAQNDIEAMNSLLELNIPIDWQEKLEGKTILANAFNMASNLDSKDLFEKILKNLNLNNNYSIWSKFDNHSIAELCLINKKFDFLSSVITKENSNQWIELAKSPILLPLIKDKSSFNNFISELKKLPLPKDFFEALKLNRNIKSWAYANNKDKIKKNPDSSDLIDFILINSNTLKQKNSLKTKDSSWKWDFVIDNIKEDKKVVSTLLISNCLDVLVFFEMQKTPNKNLKNLKNILFNLSKEKDMIEVFDIFLDNEISKILNLKNFYKNRARHNSLINKSIKNHMDFIDSINNNLCQINPIFKYALNGVISSDVKKTLKNSSNSIQNFEYCDLPKSFNDFVNHIPPFVLTSKSASDIFGLQLALTIKGWSKDINQMKKFMDSIPSSFSIKNSDGLVDLPAIAANFVKTTKPPESSLWAEFFWLHVLNLPSSRKLYWLKKSAETPELICKVNDWKKIKKSLRSVFSDLKKSEEDEDNFNSLKQSAPYGPAIRKLILINELSDITDTKPDKKLSDKKRIM